MTVFANIVGLAAVILFVLSFQCKNRRSILLVNILSRAFYVLQYILLLAFEGAAFDLIGLLATLPARQKNFPFVQRFRIGILVLVGVAIGVTGIFLYKGPLSLMPVAGVTLEIAALWLSKEKHIRIVSLLSQPFWLIYNFLTCAYGSCIGNIFTIVSILVAMFRYSSEKR